MLFENFFGAFAGFDDVEVDAEEGVEDFAVVYRITPGCDVNDDGFGKESGPVVEELHDGFPAHAMAHDDGIHGSEVVDEFGDVGGEGGVVVRCGVGGVSVVA